MATNYVLTIEEEYDYILRAQAGDKKAMQDFMLLNNGLVCHLAKTLFKHGLPMEDLVQEGNIGLIKAIQKFDVSRGVRFSTTAVDRIRTPMYAYVRKNRRPICFPNGRGVRVMTHVSEYLTESSELTDTVAKNISKDLNVSESMVRITVDYLSWKFCSIANDGFDGDGGVFETELIDTEHDPLDLCIEDESIGVLFKTLADGLDKLSDMDRDIIERRWLSGEENVFFRDLKEIYGCSGTSVRNHEIAAFKILRKCLKDLDI